MVSDVNVHPYIMAQHAEGARVANERAEATARSAAAEAAERKAAAAEAAERKAAAAGARAKRKAAEVGAHPEEEEEEEEEEDADEDDAILMDTRSVGAQQQHVQQQHAQQQHAQQQHAHQQQQAQQQQPRQQQAQQPQQQQQQRHQQAAADTRGSGSGSGEEPIGTPAPVKLVPLKDKQNIVKQLMSPTSAAKLKGSHGYITVDVLKGMGASRGLDFENDPNTGFPMTREAMIDSVLVHHNVPVR